MKKRFFLFLSVLLAASVLFASTGVVIASHFCHESKQSDVALFDREGCCSEMLGNCESLPASSNHLKNNCCELTITYHKLEVFTPGKISLMPVVAFIPFEQILFQNDPGKATSTLVLNPEDPLGIQKLKPGTKNFLHSIHTLLI